MCHQTNQREKLMIGIIVHSIFYSLVLCTIIYLRSTKSNKSTSITAAIVILSELLANNLYTVLIDNEVPVDLHRFAWFAGNLLICVFTLVSITQLHKKYKLRFNVVSAFVGFFYIAKGFNFIVGYIGIYFLNINELRFYHATFNYFFSAAICASLLTSMLKDMTKTPLRRWLQRGKSKVNRGA